MRVLGRLDPAGFDGLILPDGDGGVVLARTLAPATGRSARTRRHCLPTGVCYELRTVTWAEG